jgi:hypothetical protein
MAGLARSSEPNYFSDVIFSPAYARLILQVVKLFNLMKFQPRALTVFNSQANSKAHIEQ